MSGSWMSSSLLSVLEELNLSFNQKYTNNICRRLESSFKFMGMAEGQGKRQHIVGCVFFKACQ